MRDIYDRDRLLRMLTEDPTRHQAVVEKLHRWRTERQNKIEDMYVDQQLAREAEIAETCTFHPCINNDYKTSKESNNNEAPRSQEQFYRDQMLWDQKRKAKADSLFQAKQRALEEDEQSMLTPTLQYDGKLQTYRSKLPGHHTAKRALVQRLRRDIPEAQWRPVDTPLLESEAPLHNQQQQKDHQLSFLERLAMERPARLKDIRAAQEEKQQKEETEGKYGRSPSRNKTVNTTSLSHRSEGREELVPAHGHRCQFSHCYTKITPEPTFTPYTNPSIQYSANRELPRGTKKSTARQAAVANQNDMHSASRNNSAVPRRPRRGSLARSTFSGRQAHTARRRQEKLAAQLDEQAAADSNAFAKDCTFTPRLSPRSRRLMADRHTAALSNISSPPPQHRRASPSPQPFHTSTPQDVASMLQFVNPDDRAGPRQVSMYRDIRELQLKVPPQRQSRSQSSRYYDYSNGARRMYSGDGARGSSTSLFNDGYLDGLSPLPRGGTSLRSPSAHVHPTTSAVRWADENVDVDADGGDDDASNSPEYYRVYEPDDVEHHYIPHDMEYIEASPGQTSAIQTPAMPLDLEALAAGADVDDAALLLDRHVDATAAVADNFNHDNAEPAITAAPSASQKLPFSILLALSTWWSDLTSAHADSSSSGLDGGNHSIFTQCLPRSVIWQALRDLVADMHAAKKRELMHGRVKEEGNISFPTSMQLILHGQHMRLVSDALSIPSEGKVFPLAVSDYVTFDGFIRLYEWVHDTAAAALSGGIR